ncbi:hypothetical protein ZIOFF_066691 [Zingiber officinale]|uniref:Uncharacterized protein n=1 Tax=Zingiber officinale TaxID=94328 RepID=A0A8J5KCA5_ZINOF|nr:hypothetical protein ZIOFF_066691 [Zingiber officinale]
MAAGTTARSMVSALLPLPSQSFLGRNPRRGKCVSTGLFFSAAASSSSPDESDCNAEDCAPDKELVEFTVTLAFSSATVGKVSVEWLAAERTKVVGTFPPRNKGWTGYVEKDTAGQTNIYSVELLLDKQMLSECFKYFYVADSVISSGTAGISVDGTGNTVAITAGVALFSIAAASFILVQVGKNQPQVPTVDYAGPPLSYYIDKFKSVSIVEASVPPAPQTSSTAEASAP